MPQNILFFFCLLTYFDDQNVSPALISVLQYDWVMQCITERISHYYIHQIGFNISSINSPITILPNNEQLRSINVCI